MKHIKVERVPDYSGPFTRSNIFVNGKKVCSEDEWSNQKINGNNALRTLKEYQAEMTDKYLAKKDRLLSLEKSLVAAKADGLKPRFTEETNELLRDLDQMYDYLSIFDQFDAGEGTIEMCEALGFSPQYRLCDYLEDKTPSECEQLGEWLYDAYHSDFKETMERLRDEYDMYLSNDEYYALRGEDGSVLIN